MRHIPHANAHANVGVWAACTHKSQDFPSTLLAHRDGSAGAAPAQADITPFVHFEAVLQSFAS